MPYISASIIIQLMTTVSPTLEQLKKEGEQGRKLINQYTRYLTVVLAALERHGAGSKFWPGIAPPGHGGPEDSRNRDREHARRRVRPVVHVGGERERPAAAAADSKSSGAAAGAPAKNWSSPS